MSNTFYAVCINVAERDYNVLVKKRVGETRAGMLGRALSTYSATLGPEMSQHIKGIKVIGVEYSADRVIID